MDGADLLLIARVSSADCVLRDFEAFVAHIHEAAPGYALWTSIVRPRLTADLGF